MRDARYPGCLAEEEALLGVPDDGPGLVERQRNLYREALGRIWRTTRCTASWEIADAALVTAKEMRERSAT